MLEEALFGEDDPLRAIDAYCGRALGSGIDVVRFRRSSVGLVVGARLEDGREVVVKVHRWRADVPRLAAVHRVQAQLADAGVPFPQPLVGPEPLGTGIVTVAAHLPGDAGDAHDPALRRAVAQALYGLVSAGRSVDEPELARAAPVRDRGARRWPEPHDLRFDFDRTAIGAEWIDELADDAIARLRSIELPEVVGHLDWRVENLGFERERVVAIYDADSLGRAPEPLIVGNAMGQFTTDWTLGYEPPTVAEMLAFVGDYEGARGAPFTAPERAVLDAANLYHLAYLARCEQSDRALGFGPSTRFRDLLRARIVPRGVV